MLFCFETAAFPLCPAMNLLKAFPSRSRSRSRLVSLTSLASAPTYCLLILILLASPSLSLRSSSSRWIRSRFSRSSSSTPSEHAQLSLVSSPTGFAGLRECASACYNCVDLFGKEAYDGRKCIHACGFTRGKTVDYECSNTAFHNVARF